MCGGDNYTENLSSVVRLEDFVPADHLLRYLRTWINEALGRMDRRLCDLRPYRLAPGL